jgi:hypothetical protein
MIVSANKKTGKRKALWMLAFLLFAPAAQANTYLFSFTASQALAALQSSVTVPIQNESAYYNIFVQPDSTQISGYNYLSGSERTPNAGAEAWDANVITDPSSPRLGFDPLDPCTSDCSFAHWGKGYGQSPVTVMSNANGTGAIFINAQYSDSGVAPYGWGGGTTLATIDTIMPGSDTFQFIIQTNQTLSGSYHLVGYASALVSGSNSSFSAPIKDSLGIPFDLNVTVQTVPEPAAFGPALAAIGILFWRRRKRRSATNFESAPREVK